jgi:hypothetical protein
VPAGKNGSSTLLPSVRLGSARARPRIGRIQPSGGRIGQLRSRAVSIIRASVLGLSLLALGALVGAFGAPSAAAAPLVFAPVQDIPHGTCSGFTAIACEDGPSGGIGDISAPPAARNRRYALSARRGGNGPTALDFLPGVERLQLSGLYGGARRVLLIPSRGVPAGDRLRAVFVQVSTRGPGVVTLGNGINAKVSVGKLRAGGTQVSVGGGVVGLSGGGLAVQVSGRPSVQAFVVARLVSASTADTLHWAIGETSSALPGVGVRRRKPATLRLSSAAPAGTSAILATVSTSAGSGVLAGGSGSSATPVLASSRTASVSATALLPVSRGELFLSTASADLARVTVHVLAYVAPDAAGTPGASIELPPHPGAVRDVHGPLRERVAGELGLAAANAAAPPTGAVVAVNVLPGRGSAEVFPIPGPTNAGRIVTRAEAASPYISVGSGQAATETLVLPLRADGTLQVRATSSRVRLQLLGGAGGDIVVRAGTRLLAADDLAALTGVDENVLRFRGQPADLAALAPGDVVVSGLSRTTPHGLLRKVTAVSHTGDGLVLMTEPATVTDILSQGTISVHAAPSGREVAAVQNVARGVHLSHRAYAAGSSGSPAGANFEWSFVPDHPIGPAMVTVSGGGLQISPQFDFNANVSLFPPSLKASFTVGAHESFDGHLHVTGGFTDINLTQELAHVYFAPVDIQIGPIPIFFVPEAVIAVSLGGDAGGELTAGLSQSRTFSYGVGVDTTRSGGPFYLIDNTSPDQLRPEPPRFKGSASLSLSATAGLVLLVDWATGPEVSAGPFLEMHASTADNPWWRTYFGLEASVGLVLNLPWDHLGFSQRIAAIKAPLGNAGGPYAVVTINPKAATIQRGGQQQFTANVSGAVGPGIEWSTDGGTITSGGAYTAPTTAGTYHVKVTSSDEHAAFDEATVTVPAQAPSAPTNVVAIPAPGGANLTWSPPADDGGVKVSSFTVTASPGGAKITVAGNMTTAHFGGLAVGTTYTFTVDATNQAGLTGPLSASSAPVTPQNDEYVQVLPTSLSFEQTEVGGSSAPQTVTVYAARSKSLTIKEISLTGENADQFGLQADNCTGQTLPADGSCTFDVVFKPTSENPATADVKITDDDSSSPQSVGVSYTLPEFVWTGGGTTENWSEPANWQGGKSPHGTVGTVTFPNQSPGCIEKGKCAGITNDIPGLTVNGLSVFAGEQYRIHGDAITLGSGGLTTHGNFNGYNGDELGFAEIKLATSQTWSFEEVQSANTYSTFNIGSITGPSAALNIKLNRLSFPYLYGSDEVGPVSLSGSGGYVELGGGSLNATDGNPISITNGAGLIAWGNSGPISATGGTLGLAFYPLNINGGLSLDAASSLSDAIERPGCQCTSSGNGSVQATGPVNLGEARLTMEGIASGGVCPELPVGEVITLVSTTGMLTGTFAGLPNHTITSLSYCSGTPPKVEVNYDAHSVTAMVLSAPTVATNAAFAVTATSATLNGTVNPNGREVSECKFEYGPTSSYGSSAPCSSHPGSGTNAVAVSAPIAGLTSGTTYHFRIAAVNVGGESAGSDETLKTP